MHEKISVGEMPLDGCAMQEIIERECRAISECMDMQADLALHFPKSEWNVLRMRGIAN